MAFIVYLRTMAATTSFWDCGEFIAISNILGIPHPPGYPLYAVIGRMMIMLFPFVHEIAARVNLLSPIFSAVTIGLVYLLTVKLIEMWRGRPQNGFEEVILHLAGVLAAAFLAFAPTWWDNSIEAEVYGISMFVMCLTIWLALRWRDRIGQVGNRKMLLLIVYLLGLGLAAHMTTWMAAGPLLLFILLVDWRSVMGGIVLGGVGIALLLIVRQFQPGQESAVQLFVPVIGMAIVWAVCRKRVTSLDWDFGLWAAGLFILGLSIHAYLVIRSQLNPGIDECDPSNWDRLMYVLQRKQYEPFNFFQRRADFMYQFSHMFLRYFKWQFSWLAIGLGALGGGLNLWDREEKRFSIAAAVLLVLGILVALGWPQPVLGSLADSPLATMLIALGIIAGFFHVIKRRDLSFSILGPAFIITTLGLVVYLNMLNPQPRDRDYIYAPGYLFFAIWIGMGAWWLMGRTREWLEPLAPKFSRIAAYVLGGVLLAVALFNIKLYYFEKDRSHNWIPSDYGYNILQSALPGGIIFTNGDNDTFPVWFEQEVNNTRKDVRIVNLSLGNTEWYLKQMKANGVPFNMSNFEIDQMARRPYMNEAGEVFPVSAVAIREIIAANAGKKLTFSELISPAEEFFKKVFTPDYTEKYPVYFAVTVGTENFAGMRPHLSFEGLLYRVTPLKSNEQVNVEAARRNLNQVYRFRGIEDPKIYKDGNTQMLLGNYAVAFWNVGMAMRRKAEEIKMKSPAEAEQLRQEAVRLFERAVNIVPDRPEGQNLMAVSYLEMGQTDKAIASFHRLVDLDRKSPYPIIQLAMAFDRAGRSDSAEFYLQKAVQHSPNSGEVYGALYNYYLYSRKDTVRAVSVIEGWLAKNPQDQAARQILNELKRIK